MKETITSWWAAQSKRDQMWLTIGASFLLLFIVYSALISPYLSAQQKLEQRVEKKQQLLVWMQQQSSQLRALGGQAKQPHRNGKQSLLSLIDSSAKRLQLAQHLSRVEPDGEHSVKIWIDAVEFNQLIRWYGDLYSRHGISVDNLILDNGEPGLVKARATLRQG